MWTRQKLEKITEILKAAGGEEWPRLCKELNIKRGWPDHVITDWTYGSKPTADFYHFEPRPRHDPSRNVVIVENPWSTAYSVVMKNHKNSEYPVLGEYIELDCDVAMKILVLGVL